VTVRSALEQSVAAGEIGVQVAAYLDGRLIVDEWIGLADRERGRAVDGDTLFPVFSVTKAVTGTALHVQAERGLVAYDAPVGTYWPAFAAHGKESITVRDVLTHRAGVPQMPAGVTPETMCDWEWMVARIAEEEPVFPPGTQNAYHQLVWGWIVGEVVRRTDPAGRAFSAFVREELCEPLGIADLHLGVPDDAVDRVAPLYADYEPEPDDDELRERSMPVAVLPGPWVHDRRDVRQASLPGAGAITTARACARLFAMLANGGELDGVRLLSEARLRSLTRPRDDAEQIDAVSRMVAWVGEGGYWLGSDRPPLGELIGTTPGLLAHPGAGGSIAWADLDRRLAVSICHNHMHPRPNSVAADWRNPFLAVADAVREVARGQAAA
jgi:CubicO group peptidase (beta-lactamase class C family)